MAALESQKDWENGCIQVDTCECQQMLCLAAFDRILAGPDPAVCSSCMLTGLVCCCTCRNNLESLFQPLTDALTYYDAVSESEDLLESSYSAEISPRPRSGTITRPPSDPQPQLLSSPQGSFTSPTPNPDSVTDPSSGAAIVDSNGIEHALTSSHHSAATTAESAATAAAAEQPAASNGQQSSTAEAREVKLKSLLEVYDEPDSHAGLYNYAKALEDVEAGLLAGFFYKHFCLASNVIGSEAKGELNVITCYIE